MVREALGDARIADRDELGRREALQVRPDTDATDADDAVRDRLLETYYLQRQYHASRGRYAQSMAELKVLATAAGLKVTPEQSPKLEVTAEGYVATLPAPAPGAATTSFAKKPKVGSAKSRKREIPEGLWTKCPKCSTLVFDKELDENLKVCPKCSHHFTIGAAN